MADQEDVRQIALSLAGAREVDARFAFTVENKGKQKQFVWAWNERVNPKKPRVPRADVLAVRVHDRAEKRALLASDREKFFTEPHYDGFPAMLVRLPAVTKRELRKLVVNAWSCQAPPPAKQAAPPAQRRATRVATRKPSA